MTPKPVVAGRAMEKDVPVRRSSIKIFWALAILILTTLACWQFSPRVSHHLLSGKPVAYWLDNLSQGSWDGLLPPDNPLAVAGPEVIPSLIHAVEKRYAFREVISRYRGKLPAFLQKRVPVHAPADRMRQVAAFRLGQFGPEASNAVPCLIELLNKHVSCVGDKGRVIQALGDIGPVAKKAVPLLVQKLNDSNQWLRQTAAHSLLQIGIVPPEAIPALRQNLRDTGYVAALMAIALWVAERSPDALSRVESMLTAKGDGNTREHVAPSLGWVNQIPKELLPILKQMLKEENPSVRQGAAIALARPDAENLSEIIPVLIDGLRQGQFQIPCAQALGRIGPEAAAAKSTLEAAKGYVLRNAAQDALRKIHQ